MISVRNTIWDNFRCLLPAFKRDLLAVCILVIFPVLAYAEECELPDAKQEVECLRSLVKEMKQDIGRLVAQAKKYKASVEEFTKFSDQTDAQFRKVIEQKNSIIDKQTEIIGQHEEDLELSTEQMQKYRVCCLGNPKGRIRLHVGIGATSNDSDAKLAGMLGVGLGDINLYGFVQSDNSGILLGYQF